MLNEQRTILKMCYKRDVPKDQVMKRLHLDEEQLQSLLTQDFIDNYLKLDWVRMTAKRLFVISNGGREYVQQLRRNGFQFWVPVGISAALSVAAITVSIISLTQ